MTSSNHLDIHNHFFGHPMNYALDLARQAGANGDVPVGAVVVDAAGAIIGAGQNERYRSNNPLDHAEIIALREASKTLQTWNLEQYTLVVTMEPCPMCAGAAVMAHVGKIVFGAWDLKMGACGSVWDIPRDPHIGFSPQIIGGFKEKESVELLKDFFIEKRQS